MPDKSASAGAALEGLKDVATLFNVQGMVAVITGGGTGIGLMMAKALENNGATVYIVANRLEILEEAARNNNRYGKIIPLRCDVSCRESILGIVKTIKERHGYINLLVNNAGVAHNLLPKLPTPTSTNGDITAFQDVLWNAGTPEEFAHSFDVNTTGIWYTTVAFLELLDAGNKQGNMEGVTSQVVTVASGGAFRKDDKVFSVSYTLSKAAATHLGKMMANFLNDWQIRSNVVAPGIWLTPMTEGVVDDAIVKAGVPMNRVGDINDMGGLILFLASKAGSYVNGTVQLIDGGRLTLFPSTY
ncbi:NAD-P-binding protein [Cristinia sonorae]|uniref:NAD-P-binding protein n=1 Tax=Cristinia sonorae TaxID=1940300 RepID=A0A8K0UGG4_9AGAR|nr:NAD-P-binding protein [Cristinia sonorae]